jgi:hypothetical protein
LETELRRRGADRSAAQVNPALSTTAFHSRMHDTALWGTMTHLRRGDGVCSLRFVVCDMRHGEP